MRSCKYGYFLTPLPPLSYSYALRLMYLCHKKTKSPPPFYVTSFMNDPLGIDFEYTSYSGDPNTGNI